MKDGHREKASTTFSGTEVCVSDEDQRYFGSAIGKKSFLESYLQQKVDTWIEELKLLSSIATTQPHSAFAAFTHGFSSRWTFLARTTSSIADLFKPLKETIRMIFLPKLTDQNAFSHLERQLLALSACLGGLDIANPCDTSSHQFTTSVSISASFPSQSDH